jgi:NNP family nitrate/nitrite transporter-like MFS transporter
MTMRIDARGAGAGTAAVALLSAAIFWGSRGLRDFDLVLLPYTLGVLFAAFAVAYRYAVWLQRPATALYWRRGFQLLFRRGGRAASLVFLLRSAYENLFAQKLIRRRGSGRWVAHFCLAWGSLVAGAVTFPLVFGWLHFETRPADPQWYRVVAAGHVLAEFHTASLARYVLFNLLNVSAVMVIAGSLLALRRRLRDPGARARQQFGNDIVPLLLLIAISATGLMLTLSMHVLHGYAYAVISLVHALVVTGTLLYIPFGKLFHIFQRPAQLGVALYRRADAAIPAACGVCGENFAGAMHVGDLKGVLAGVDLDATLEGPVSHFAEVCPRCRRRLFGFTQGLLLGRSGSA